MLKNEWAKPLIIVLGKLEGAHDTMIKDFFSPWEKKKVKMIMFLRKKDYVFEKTRLC